MATRSEPNESPPDRHQRSTKRYTNSDAASATTLAAVAFSAVSSGASNIGLDSVDVWPSLYVTVPSMEAMGRRRARAGVLSARCAADSQYWCRARR